MTRDHPNIVVIGSAIHERAILQAIRTLGHERVCFGSDMPFFLMHARLAMYEALLRDFEPEARECVLGGNILRLLEGEKQTLGRAAAAGVSFRP